ncbi:MAG: pip4, partial [Thermomicrobiales bacterium]|nr:pip4 [Thermomicrobiales bacterium]
MTGRSEGYIDVGDGRVWYESAGMGDRTLLLLHGGPGGNSEDLSPFLDLAVEGFRVVRYDQLCSWRSEKPDDLSLWQVPRFVAEVEKVREALDLGKVHLLGQSWGAFLAIEYALHHGERLRSLTLASGAASTRECVAGMNFWRRELPRETQAILAHHEANQDYTHPNYLEAMDALYRRHFCRVQPWPEPLKRASEHMAMPVYTTMWGPNEFTCTGNLLDWDRTDRLGEITVPTLITVGEFDEVHPSCAHTLQAGIPGSRLEIFPGCGHAVHLEDHAHYRDVLLRFLDRVDAPKSLYVRTTTR